MKDGSPKCFHEELPKDTLVVGMFALLYQTFSEPYSKYQGYILYRFWSPKYHAQCMLSRLEPANIQFIGHYTISQYDQQSHSFSSPSTLGLYITVEEVFDSHHRIVSQKGDAKGRFTFSAADSGEHRLCFSPTNWQSLGSYVLGGEEMGGLRVEIDMAIGETSAIESTDKSKMEDLVTRIKDLNGRLADVRREQVFQRVRRDVEDSTNT